MSASTVLTVATFRDGHPAAAFIEMSPPGCAVVRPGTDGWVIHTNSARSKLVARMELAARRNGSDVLRHPADERRAARKQDHRGAVAFDYAYYP
ncbi:hypothetical protein ACIP4X_35210 [Streptomyces sp. NPDC088817]|uniref:hypothetical protein n=1 Tax=unclassified Streptomyces TaxID=2593676 RepID=UPI0036ED0670